MNPSIPFLICHKNKSYRGLIKEMLSKMGFYHILDIDDFESPEKLDFFKNRKNIFLLIEDSQVNPMIISSLNSKKFIILTQNESDYLVKLTALYGLERILTFPFTSDFLSQKIDKMI